jgi:rSAM/selenodomain-associated transferase 1
MHSRGRLFVPGEHRVKRVSGSKRCIIIFTKFPVPGKVKTRLVPTLTKLQACALYKKLVESTLKTAQKTRHDTIVCYHPAKAKAAFAKWLGKTIKYFPQKGSGLGSKMKNAFTRAFGLGYDKALLIGCDIPGLSAGLLNNAFRKLDRDDAILGPASDGGYYLIGFTKENFLPEVFKGIEWSAPSVFQKTIQVFMNDRYKVAFAPKLSDIDTPEDLFKPQPD